VTPEETSEFIQQVMVLTQDKPGVRCYVERGARHVNDHATGWIISETTDGISISIEVNGGAKETWE